MTTPKAEKKNKIPVFDQKGKKLEDLELDAKAFDGKVNETVLYQASIMYRANRRQGNSDTKTRAEVRGGGKKPWRQKGTGRARVSSIRNPIWRGGGIAFGPHPRDFRYSLPKKMLKKAFIASLNAKLNSGNLVALEEIALSEPKTKNVARILKGLKLDKRVLLIVKEIDKNLGLASRNIKALTLKRASDATALDVLLNDHVVIARNAAELITKRGGK